MTRLQLIPFDHRHHLEILYAMMMTPEEQSMFMMSGRCNSLKEFDGWIQDRLRMTYQEFFMIGVPGIDSPIGFIYANEMRVRDGHCKIGAYIIPTERKKGLGAWAAVQMMDYLFKFYPLRKIYSDVYDYNEESLKNHIDAGFCEEGRLKGYKYFDGDYHDMHVFSMDKEVFKAKYSKLLVGRM